MQVNVPAGTQQPPLATEPELLPSARTACGPRAGAMAGCTWVCFGGKDGTVGACAICARFPLMNCLRRGAHLQTKTRGVFVRRLGSLLGENPFYSLVKITKSFAGSRRA